MSKHRTPLLDYDTAVDLANLCSMNLQKVVESERLQDKVVALLVAREQYKTVRRYALDVAGWCRNTRMPRDRESLQCVWIMRDTLRYANEHLRTLEEANRLANCRTPYRSQTRLRAAYN